MKYYRTFEYNGETLTLSQWATKLDISQRDLYNRVDDRDFPKPIKRAIEIALKEKKNESSCCK